MHVGKRIKEIRQESGVMAKRGPQSGYLAVVSVHD